MANEPAKKSVKQSGGLSGPQFIKLGAAVVIILGCLAWLGYFMFGNQPPSEFAVTTPCDRFAAAAGSVFHDEKFERVVLVASPDGKTTTITGKVPDEAQMNELKGAFEKAAAEVAAKGEPVQLKWELKIGK